MLPENLRRAPPLLRHGCVTAIPGASSVEQLEHNVAAADLVLGDDEIAALGEAARAFRPVGGARAAVSLVRERVRA